MERQSDLEPWLHPLRTPEVSLSVRMDDVWLFELGLQGQQLPVQLGRGQGSVLRSPAHPSTHPRMVPMGLASNGAPREVRTGPSNMRMRGVEVVNGRMSIQKYDSRVDRLIGTLDQGEDHNPISSH